MLDSVVFTLDSAGLYEIDVDLRKRHEELNLHGLAGAQPVVQVKIHPGIDYYMGKTAYDLNIYPSSAEELNEDQGMRIFDGLVIVV